MEEKKILKLYMRFLKEEGIYYRAIKIHKNAAKKRNLEKYFDVFNVTPPDMWIQNSYIFCHWLETKEGQMFWWLKDIYWKFECYKIDKNDLLKRTISSSIQSILSTYILTAKDSKKIEKIRTILFNDYEEKN